MSATVVLGAQFGGYRLNQSTEDGRHVLTTRLAGDEGKGEQRVNQLKENLTGRRQSR